MLQVDEIQNKLQELTGRVEEDQYSIDKSLREIRARIGSLEKTTPGGAPPRASSAPVVAVPNAPSAAFLDFEDVVKKFPQGNKVPDALVKQGLCFKLLGDTSNARIILQRVKSITTTPALPSQIEREWSLRGYPNFIAPLLSLFSPLPFLKGDGHGARRITPLKKCMRAAALTIICRRGTTRPF